MRGRVVAIVLLGLAACGGAERPPVEDPDEPSTRPPPRIIDDGEDVDDGLELQSTRGRMDPADVEAGISPHAAALQDCYLSRVGKQKWMGGKVELKWEIAGDGTITSAQLASADLGAWPVEKCLLDTARAMAFAKPRGGAADFTVPLEFSARGNATWWDEDRGKAVVSKRVAELATCAAEAGVADPTDVTVTVYVGTRGKVQSAGFASPALIDDAWAACAHAKILAWMLSDPKGKVAKLSFVYREGETPQPAWADEGGW